MNFLANPIFVFTCLLLIFVFPFLFLHIMGTYVPYWILSHYFFFFQRVSSLLKSFVGRGCKIGSEWADRSVDTAETWRTLALTLLYALSQEDLSVFAFHKGIAWHKVPGLSKDWLVILMVSAFFSLLWSLGRLLPLGWKPTWNRSHTLVFHRSAELWTDVLRMFPFCFSVTHLEHHIRAWLFRTMTHLVGGNSFLAYRSKRHFSSCNPPTFWFRWDIWWIFFIITSCVFLFPLHWNVFPTRSPSICMYVCTCVFTVFYFYFFK